MENVKVIIWGLGAMGGGMADMLLKKQGVDIVGVAGRGKKIGTSMYDYIKTERGDRPDVIIQAAEDVIKPGAADVVLLCGARESPLEAGSIAAKIAVLFVAEVLVLRYTLDNQELTALARDRTSKALAPKLL